MKQEDKYRKLRKLPIEQVDVIARRSREHADNLNTYFQSLKAGKASAKVSADIRKWMNWALLAEEYLRMEINRIMTQ
jgi:hypothetical protein